MNTIDWDVVNKLIEQHKPKSVSVGMAQDWYWTAQTVWENGEWKDLKRLTKMSHWATPSVELEFEDGSYRKESCSKEANEVEIEICDQERKEFSKQLREIVKSLESKREKGV